MKNKLIYGLNQADEWTPLVYGETRQDVQARFRDVEPRVLRIFLFDKSGPDTLGEWHVLRHYVQAVLDVGAVPMITFAKLRGIYDDPRAIRVFAEECADVVWSCMQQWGAEEVVKWYWAVWNEPNSTLIGGGLGFDQYKRIYEAVARRCAKWLTPHLGGKKMLFGGPGIEAFQPLWMDWAHRFVREIDDELVGFLDWHTYGEWRREGEYGASSDPSRFREGMLWATHDYESRAKLMSRLIRGRSILNVCGEYNAHSHEDPEVRRRFNYTTFTATFYASALVHLLRGGVDLEMYWSGVDSDGGYGMLDAKGNPRPVFYAKKLAVNHVRTGDLISFPDHHDARFDIVVSRGDDGRTSAFVSHVRDAESQLASELLATLVPDAKTVHKIDGGTAGGLTSAPYERKLSFEGFGVAVVTNRDE